MKEIDLAGQLADMKETDYHLTLALTSLLEVLVKKDIIKKEEISQMARKIESDSLLSSQPR